MRRSATLIGLLAVLAPMAVLSGSAGAAATKKLVEGTVYDSTCATACTPECPPPPHCGPITQSLTDVVCAQPGRIVCPLARVYPLYAGEGAVVSVRRRGSATVLATLPIVGGHFKIRLGPGEYVLHPDLPETQCWSAEPAKLQITAKLKSPVPATLDAANHCVRIPNGQKTAWLETGAIRP